ncbi:class I SAM-dependent DNA methyltransferase [Dechloromonas sp.]|uniref:HsdM family class I SAM-dependent methyltransferase n=1 Tax=Dechloromonas sp. TaxID=1917218 RepID=UPI00263F7C3F|nr:N-6 DNA methylase [Dechloromonas sp.]
MTEESGAPASGPSKHKVLNLDLLMGPKATAQTSIGTVYLYSLRASDISEFRKLRADDPAERVREFLPCIASLSERSSFKEEREPLPTELAAQLTEADLDALGTAYASPTVLGAAREYHQCSLSERVGTTWKSACKPAQHLKYSVIRTVFNQITLWVRARLELGDSYSGAFAIFSNPPFGKKWEKDSDAVNTEHKEKKYDGRFGPGLPRINDGSMLFLMHLASKLELPENGGGRAAIVLSGSPLFNGGAGSGESEIRRWLLENDLVEAIVALPTEIFFRTGIGTYLWILSNKKDGRREKRVQLINATGFWSSINNEGNKRRIVDDDQRRQIVDIYAAAENSDVSRMIDYRTFGYRRIKVLRPLRMSLVINDEGLAKLQEEKAWQKLSPEHQQIWLDALRRHMGATHLFGWTETFADETVRSALAAGKVIKAGKTFIKALTNAFGVRDPLGEPVLDADGAVVADPELTDYENVPLTEDIRDYLAREVLPHLPDAYIDETFRDDKDKEIGRVGYEINFNRFFYQYVPPRKLHDIDAELKQVESEIAALLAEVATE